MLSFWNQAAGCSGTGPGCPEGFRYFGVSFEEMCPNRVTYPPLLIKTVMCIRLGSGSLKKNSPFSCVSLHIYMINYCVERLILNHLVLLLTWGCDTCVFVRSHKPISLWCCMCTPCARWGSDSGRKDCHLSKQEVILHPGTRLAPESTGFSKGLHVRRTFLYRENVHKILSPGHDWEADNFIILPELLVLPR